MHAQNPQLCGTLNAAIVARRAYVSRARSDQIESEHALETLILSRNPTANRSHFVGLRPKGVASE
jgi:hypothetical protein